VKELLLTFAPEHKSQAQELSLPLTRLLRKFLHRQMTICFFTLRLLSSVKVHVHSTVAEHKKILYHTAAFWPNQDEEK